MIKCAHQRWVNNKKFDGGQLTSEEADLRDFYKRLLNFTIHSSALTEHFQGIHEFNLHHTPHYNDKVFSFVRWSDTEKLIVVSNFNSDYENEFELKIPQDIIEKWNLVDGTYGLQDQLYHQFQSALNIKDGNGTFYVKLKTLESFILKIQ